MGMYQRYGAAKIVVSSDYDVVGDCCRHAYKAAAVCSHKSTVSFYFSRFLVDVSDVPACKVVRSNA